METVTQAQIHKEALTRLVDTVEKTESTRFYSMLDRYIEYVLGDDFLVELVMKSRRFGAETTDQEIQSLSAIATQQIDVACSELLSFCGQIEQKTDRLIRGLDDLEIWKQGRYFSSKLPCLQYYDHVCYVMIALNEAGYHTQVKQYAELRNDDGIEVFTYAPAAIDLGRLIEKINASVHFDTWDAWRELLFVHYIIHDNFPEMTEKWGQYLRVTPLSFSIQQLENRETALTDGERNKLQTYVWDVHNYLLRELDEVQYGSDHGQGGQDDKPATGSEHTPTDVVDEEIPKCWEDISVEMINQHEVRIKIKGQRAYQAGYSDLGMIDKRTREPSVQWKLLNRYAEGKGSLSWNSNAEKKKMKKRKQRMGDELKKYFKQSDTPFFDEDRFTSGKGKDDEAMVSVLRMKVTPVGELSDRETAGLDHELSEDYGEAFNKLTDQKGQKSR